MSAGSFMRTTSALPPEPRWKIAPNDVEVTPDLALEGAALGLEDPDDLELPCART